MRSVQKCLLKAILLLISYFKCMRIQTKIGFHFFFLTNPKWQHDKNDVLKIDQKQYTWYSTDQEVGHLRYIWETVERHLLCFSWALPSAILNFGKVPGDFVTNVKERKKERN